MLNLHLFYLTGDANGAEVRICIVFNLIDFSAETIYLTMVNALCVQKLKFKNRIAPCGLFHCYVSKTVQ